jgi:small GTP-binding protein
MREQYIRVGEGFLLVFSLTDHHSLDECRKLYRDIKRIKDSDNVPILLVGNKFDIRQISVDTQARAVAAAMQIPYFETSARTRFNIDEIFIELVRIIRRNKCQYEMNNIALAKQPTSHCLSCNIL